MPIRTRGARSPTQLNWAGNYADNIKPSLARYRTDVNYHDSDLTYVVRARRGGPSIGVSVSHCLNNTYDRDYT